MNSLQDKTIKKMYEDSFSNIVATDRFKENLIESFPNNSMKNNNYTIKKIATIAACIVFMILITNFNSIRAGILSLYERFIIKTETTYITETEDYFIDANEIITLPDNSNVIIEQCVLTNKGIDIKLSHEEDSKYEVVGCELGVNSNRQYYSFQQEMISKFNIGHICSYVYDGEKSFIAEKLIDQVSNIKINLLYIDENYDGEVLQKDIEFDLKFLKVYPVKTSNLKNEKNAQNKYFNINKITINTWYMKVEYERKLAEEEYEWLVLNLKQNDTELMVLGGEEADNKFTFYYEVPQNNEKIKIIPELLKIENNKEENLILDEGIELNLKDIFREEE